MQSITDRDLPDLPAVIRRMNSALDRAPILNAVAHRWTSPTVTGDEAAEYALDA